MPKKGSTFNKEVHDFELTLARCKLSKEHIYNSLQELYESLIVSHELHTPECNDTGSSEDPQDHYHCYIKRTMACDIQTLREEIAINIEAGETYEGSIHISTLRSAKNWIKYITKEDTHPAYHGVDPSYFHISHRCHLFVRSNRSFVPTHAFVRQHPALINILEKMHAHYWANKTIQIDQQTIRHLMPKFEVKWVQDVRDALSRRKHLLIQGPTGVGKSNAVKWYLKYFKRWCNTVKLLCSEREFEFSQLDHSTEVAYADDIDEGYIMRHRQRLLQLLDGGLVTIDPKCERIRSFIAKFHFVFISNYEVKLDDALKRRLVIINTGDDIGYVQTKNEIQEEEEIGSQVIEISSEEED